jgi:hypothetical protein
VRGHRLIDVRPNSNLGHGCTESDCTQTPHNPQIVKLSTWIDAIVPTSGWHIQYGHLQINKFTNVYNVG